MILWAVEPLRGSVMASRTWLTNAVKAGIVTAAIGAIGSVASAYAGRTPCPPANYCDTIIKTVGASGKAADPSLQKAYQNCLAHSQ